MEANITPPPWVRELLCIYLSPRFDALLPGHALPEKAALTTAAGGTTLCGVDVLSLTDATRRALGLNETASSGCMHGALSARTFLSASYPPP